MQDADMKQKVKFVMDHICRFLQLGRHVPGQELTQVEHKDSEFGLILNQAALAYLAKNMIKEDPGN